MSSFNSNANYITKQTRELNDTAVDCIPLTPWMVQSLVYKIIQNHMLENDPKKLGYSFDQKYNTDPTKSQIALEISYNWKADIASTRPAVFIARGDADLRYPTMRQGIGRNTKESEHVQFAMVSMPVRVLVVASPVGFAEQLADYVRQPLSYYAQAIQEDFGFERFRLVQIGRPQIYVEAKDNFVVELNLQVDYSDGWVVRGDHLKLKTFSATIFEELNKKPIENA